MVLVEVTLSCGGLNPLGVLSILHWANLSEGPQTGNDPRMGWDFWEDNLSRSSGKGWGWAGEKYFATCGQSRCPGRDAEKREWSFTSLFLRQKGGWVFWINILLQKVTKVLSQGHKNNENLKSRRKGVGFLGHQNVSVGLDWKNFQHIAWEEILEIFLQFQSPCSKCFFSPSCLEMAVYIKNSIYSSIFPEL